MEFEKHEINSKILIIMSIYNREILDYNDGEMWNGIPGWEDLYEVSSAGRVRSLDRVVKNYRSGTCVFKGKIMKYNLARGYHTVLLYRSATDKKRHGVHLLMGKAFLGNPENKKTINHKNTIKTDNYLSNLEWATYSEQQIHAVKNNLRDNSLGESSNFSKLIKEEVLEIRELFDSKSLTIKELAVKFKTAKSNIQYIVNRETWKHI
jgi:hypothetical protein